LKKYAKTKQAQGTVGCTPGGMSGCGAVSQKQECLWRIEWFNLHTATFFETKQARAGIATALMAHTKQYLLSPAGLQNAALIAVAWQNDALIDANAQPNPTLVPTLGGPIAKSLAKQSANPEHVQVGKKVDNTVASRKERRRVEANEKRRDEQWVGGKFQAPSAGGGALAKPDQRKSTPDDALTHKVYEKGRLPVLAKTWLENPGVFTDPFDAFVVVITKQLSVITRLSSTP